MSYKSKKVVSEASGIFPILQEKKITQTKTDKFPVWDNRIGDEDRIPHIFINEKWIPDPNYVSKTVWRDLSTLERLKFVDITIGGPLPSLILKCKTGELGLMTIAHFRNLVKAGKIDLTDGMISGIFRIVKYANDGYYWYLEVV